MEINIETPFGKSLVIVKEGILGNIEGEIKKNFSQEKIFVVSDRNVFELYGNEIVEKLASEYKVETFVFNPGEESKNIVTYTRILEKMALFNLSRSDMVIALGGGVVGDVAGFAAATFKRGVRFTMIPTTLLSQVDASVGGKTAINLQQGKNLVGSFYCAEKVLIDPLVLRTLSERNLMSGFAEVIKCACIKDKELFNILKNSDNHVSEEIIIRAVKIKASIVQNDPFDKDERMLLNFGHTYGHAIEKESDSMLHGEAVAIGIMYVTARSENLGITKEGTSKEIESLLRKYNLPTKYNGDKKKILNYLSQDKKHLGGKLRSVVISEIGRGEIIDVSNEFWEVNL